MTIFMTFIALISLKAHKLVKVMHGVDIICFTLVNNDL